MLLLMLVNDEHEKRGFERYYLFACSHTQSCQRSAVVMIESKANNNNQQVRNSGRYIVERSLSVMHFQVDVFNQFFLVAPQLVS